MDSSGGSARGGLPHAHVAKRTILSAWPLFWAAICEVLVQPGPRVRCRLRVVGQTQTRALSLLAMSSSWPLLPLTPEPPPVAMSVAAWLERGEHEPGELVSGKLVEEEMPDATHETIVAWLLWTLKTWLGSRGLVLGSDLRILVAEQTGRGASSGVVTRGPAPIGLLCDLGCGSRGICRL